jgi:hypothetical protein
VPELCLSNSPPMSTSRLTELLPQLQDNRQLETFWALKCGRQDLYVKCLWRCLSPNTQAVLDLCIALLDSLSTLLPATLRECGNLRSSRTGNLGRGRQYLLTIFLLLPRESSDLDTVLWTRHRLPLRKSRDWGNLRCFLVAVHELGRGRQCIRDIFAFRN